MVPDSRPNQRYRWARGLRLLSLCGSAVVYRVGENLRRDGDATMIKLISNSNRESAMKKFLFAMALSPLLSLNAPNMATAAPCSDTLANLIALGSCSVEDKLFSNFSFTPSGGGAGNVTAATITVSPLASIVPTVPDPGLQFQGSWIAVGTFSSARSTIGYTVTDLDPASRIDDAELHATVTTSAVEGGTATATVSETLTGPTSSPILNVGVPPGMFLDSAVFGPVATLGVSLDISVAVSKSRQRCNHH